MAQSTMNEERKTTKPTDGKTPVSGLPASQRVTAPDCVSCCSEDTFIYCTREVMRYCKCRHCGHTWSFGRTIDG
jgi:hypothetical protein